MPRLTLDAYVSSAKKEEVRGDGELDRRPAAGEEGDGNVAAIPGFPSRFLARGGRGRRGEGGCVLRSTLRFLERRRFAAATSARSRPWRRRERERARENIGGERASGPRGGLIHLVVDGVEQGSSGGHGGERVQLKRLAVGRYREKMIFLQRTPWTYFPKYQ